MVTAESVRAVVFDMDGLLIDSEPLWRTAQVEAFSSVGVPITEEDARSTMGLRTDEVVALWFGRRPWPGPTEAEVAAAIVGRLIALVRERARYASMSFIPLWRAPPGSAGGLSVLPHRPAESVPCRCSVRSRPRPPH